MCRRACQFQIIVLEHRKQVVVNFHIPNEVPLKNSMDKDKEN